MRTIKFRQALYINGKFYKFRFWGFGLIDEPKEKFFMPEISAWEGGDSSIDCLQKPEESMQFTGLHDKNGKEIYEGDIVLSHHNNESAEIKFGVFNSRNDYGDSYENGFYFCEQKGKIDLGCALSLDINGSSEKIEVIGNIYENPELLKEGAA